MKDIYIEYVTIFISMKILAHIKYEDIHFDN